MKRILSLVLTVIMLLSSLSVVAFADDGYWKREDNLSVNQPIRTSDLFKVGDCNADGEINAGDSLLIAMKVVDDKTELVFDAADVDGDGKVTAKDRFCLKACFAGAATIDTYDKGERVRNFTVGGVDISEFTLVLPEGTNYNDNIYFAYEILLKYIEKMTGVTLTRVYDDDFNGHAIRLHNVDLNSELGKELGDDGFRYFVKDGNLEIYGATRGNMYAAYEIVEKYLGVFFYSSEYTFSDRIGSSDIPEGLDRQFTTPTVFRFAHHTFGHETNTHYYAIPRHHNSTVRQINPESYYGYFTGSLKLNAHSFYYYQAMGSGVMPPEGTLNDDGTVMTLAQRYYQKFLNGGGGAATDFATSQPCTSNEDTYQTLYTGMVETIAMMEAEGRYINFAKNRHMISFSINDNNKYCTCSVCRAKAEGRSVSIAGDHDTVSKMMEKYTGYYKIGETKRNRTTVTFKKENDSGIYLALENRAAKDIKKLYPDIQVFAILYVSDVPETVRPESNMVLCYCVTIDACAKCHFGETENCKPKHYECHSLALDEERIKEWGAICKNTGAELWAWYYPENYTFYLLDLPKFFDIYYDFKWMCENGVTGFFYEGVQTYGPEYLFCSLNAYLATEMMWDPDISYDEYVGLMKKYLRAKYSDGYEHLYNYIVYLNEASEQSDTNCGCYYYRVFDMYSKSYLAEHYEDMRNEVLLAIEERNRSNGDPYKWWLDYILMNCDLLGLSASYDSMYTNGTTESRKLYEERYTWVYNIITERNPNITGSENTASFKRPSTLRFDESPLKQIYGPEYRWG